ncbi:hypothetical protein JXA88_04905 [Candidatus Fermentibacteria bacterium]|nr:hypothetical protein [Candidatus Fermentibacteria bacterium]
MFSDVRVQGIAVAILAVISAALLLAVVQRATMMRKLEVDVQATRATRDSLDAAASSARIDLVRLSRADKVFCALRDSGFVVADAARARFLLYPGKVPAGDGVLTGHLAAQLREDHHTVRGNEAWLWGWVRRVPSVHATGGVVDE